jgi:hypothetical protein
MKKNKKFDLSQAKDFVIRECAPQKKRDRLAKEAAWELYKELYPVEAAEWEQEVVEDDAELEQEEIKIEMEKPSIWQEIINQTKVFGVAGLLGISSGLYFQSQAVYEGANEIIITVSDMATANLSTDSGNAENSPIVGNESQESRTQNEGAEQVSESQEAAGVAEEAAGVAEEAADNAANQNNKGGSQENAETSAPEPALEPTIPEPVVEAQMPESEAEEETQEESEPDDSFIEPLIIEIPEIIDVEIPSQRG